MRILLHPAIVAAVLKALSDEEAAELAKTISTATNEVDACAKVSDWMLKRFPQLGVSLRRSAAAGMN